jgi:hypothetical protein
MDGYNKEEIRHLHAKDEEFAGSLRTRASLRKTAPDTLATP